MTKHCDCCGRDVVSSEWDGLYGTCGYCAFCASLEHFPCCHVDCEPMPKPPHPRRQRLIELERNSLWMARREQDRWHDNEQRDMHVADAMKLRRMRHNENPAPKSPNME